MGWVVEKPEDYKQGKLQWKEFKPKEFRDDDVQIDISHCGICYSVSDGGELTIHCKTSNIQLFFSRTSRPLPLAGAMHSSHSLSDTRSLARSPRSARTSRLTRKAILLALAPNPAPASNAAAAPSSSVSPIAREA